MASATLAPAENDGLKLSFRMPPLQHSVAHEALALIDRPLVGTVNAKSDETDLWVS